MKLSDLHEDIREGWAVRRSSWSPGLILFQNWNWVLTTLAWSTSLRRPCLSSAPMTLEALEADNWERTITVWKNTLPRKHRRPPDPPEEPPSPYLVNWAWTTKGPCTGYIGSYRGGEDLMWTGEQPEGKGWIRLTTLAREAGSKSWIKAETSVWDILQE